MKSSGPADGISPTTRPGDPRVVSRSASGRLHRYRVDREALLTPSSTELLPPLSLGVLLLRPGNALTAICERKKKNIRGARSRETWIYYREKERERTRRTIRARTSGERTIYSSSKDLKSTKIRVRVYHARLVFLHVLRSEIYFSRTCTGKFIADL